MRCYFMRGGHVAAVESLDKAPDDDAAIRQAAIMFIARTGEFEGCEIWDQNRVVFRFPDHPPFSPAA
jgi:hypothetical protein